MTNKECTCKKLITDKNEIKIISQCDNCYKREIKKLKILKSISETAFNFITQRNDLQFKKDELKFNKALQEELKKRNLEPIPNYRKGTNDCLKWNENIKPKSINYNKENGFFSVSKNYEFENEVLAKSFYEKERDLMFYKNCECKYEQYSDLFKVKVFECDNCKNK